MSSADDIRVTLARSLEWLLSQRDEQGRILCPEHRVEHTGKSACAAITAAELWRASGDRAHRAAAVQQGLRLVANLKREGDSPCHTFRPGRHDPFNCSNSVIDGGAASDALAHLVTTLGDQLRAPNREAFAEASLLHARTYLRYAVVDKGVPAQRAWGLTGLAGALSLEHDEDLEQALLAGVKLLEEIQHDDGSYPYHPLEWGAEHPGASDVSSYYQSRVTAFVMYALERSGRDPRDAAFDGALRAGLGFLRALAGPDGIKTGLVEAKPWYWGATYEVASHPFDVFALARGHSLFGERALGLAAAASYRAWEAHLAADGEPRSHLPGPGRGRSYQCGSFWGAHACWIARAVEDLADCMALEEREEDDSPRVTWMGDAQLARLEDRQVVAWVRGARPGSNVLHGSPHGAGLLRVLRREDGRELIERCGLGGANEGEWRGRAGLPSPGRGLDAGSEALRFSFWLSRVHWRAGRVAPALAAPLKTLRRGVLAFAHPRVGSAFELEPQVEMGEAQVGLTGRLCHRGGHPARDSALQRRFRVDGRGLLVEERLLDPGRARAVDYAVPKAATDVQRSGERISYRLS